MKTHALMLCTALLLGGCANHASFVTKTSLAVLDVDSTPAEASIAFSRSEGYVGPRFNDGSVYPVTGFINARGRGLSRETQQVFAGGAAALGVLGQAPVTPQDKQCEDDRRPPLYLATGTSVGLRVGFVDNTPLPSSFSLGYRRKEATLVPVDKNCQPSVLATHDSDAGARTQEGETKAQAHLGITQYFATGTAAEALSQKPEVREMFRRGQQSVKNAVAAFEERERGQLRGTVAVLACASAVDDTRFESAVLVNARELDLLAENGFDKVMREAPGAARRLRYAQQLELRAGADDARGVALELHRARVCKLAGVN